jgi:tRNA pseudouridine32 synthase/23S rRNA pseudouridine746 synthase
MFGVLVVKDADGRLGYLSAFSGKLGDSNHHEKFVPPVYDMLDENGFFIKGQLALKSINKQVKGLEADETYKRLKAEFEKLTTQSVAEINEFKKQSKVNKEERKTLRKNQKANLDDEGYADLEAYLIRYSLHDKHQFNVLTCKWGNLLIEKKQELAKFEDSINALKQQRKEMSFSLQQQLFENYVFLNKDKEVKSLQAIFKNTVFGKPPAAAGECATPKLLQYAFLNNYNPIAMAEFWWGVPPKSEIRQHKQFYPACTGKCKPILEHMLQGMAVDDNPLLNNTGETKKLEIIYEDDSFVVVNKPAGLLSVPGTYIKDSVYTRLQAICNGIEPLIIHRLDMATSGLLVVAKTKEAHKEIQRQFIKRTVVKRYTALLSKIIEYGKGEINFPLRVDIMNRPRQMVCFDSGKKAVTKWKVVKQNETSTKIHFWPLTGRSHQLRMHAAHELGLNAPIVGDSLYGTIADRLYLHAAYLEFMHPVSNKIVKLEVAEDF